MADDLENARNFYELRRFAEAYEALSRAGELGAEELELLGLSAYLSGYEERLIEAFDRAHRAHLEAGSAVRAARCAFWIGLVLLVRGEAGASSGWLARARRLLGERDTVEQGYLLLPIAEREILAGDCEAAARSAGEAAAIGERFGDADLTACARHVRGRALMLLGRGEPGLALLDDAMLAVTSGELSPLMTGLIYCSVIDACQTLYVFDRAREWTLAMARWCDAQPQLLAFSSTCRVHRAAVLETHGAWQQAFSEACSACESRGSPPAAAFYRQAELHRLRGEFVLAEAAFRRASDLGCEPQPGFALLRLVQGRTSAALASIRRVVDATTIALDRARLLPAYAEILLAAGEHDEARRAAAELQSLAESLDNDVLGALSAQASGAVELASGDARAATALLRKASRVWQELGAPYLLARARELLGLACAALGDEDGKRLELDAARSSFAELGAAPDVARVDALMQGRAKSVLSAREIEVLGLVAAGKTNKQIAEQLGLSKKTIDRHVSNILTKLDVPSRAAATAYAYAHQLIAG